MKSIFLLFFILSCPVLFSQEESDKISQDEGEKHPILSSKFQIQAGLFVPSKSVKIGADGSSPNDNINFSESFNLNDSQATLFFNFDWRFSKKWKLGVEYFAINNAKKAELQEDIEFENIIFKKGTNIRAGFGIDMIRIYVGRSFSRGLKHEFGAGLGVHALNTSAFVEGDVLTSEGDISFERRSVNALVPLPNLGFWYYYTPTPKLALIARIDWFGITIGDYSGLLWNIAPSVKYQLFKHIGVGVAYRSFTLRANVNQSSWKGQFRMNFNGPLFTVNANF